VTDSTTTTAVKAANPLLHGHLEELAIAGAFVHTLPVHVDHRGTISVIDATGMPGSSAQWLVAVSASRVLRGVHVHRSHSDRLSVVSGTLLLLLRDLRRDSVSFGTVVQRWLRPPSPDGHSSALIPPGVAHAFVFVEPTVHLYGIDELWSPNDEFGCVWTDTALEMEWPDQLCREGAIVSARDAAAGNLAELQRLVDTWSG
jgi:dTDP-4-dehydrorhamnose 3,5-epimerase